MTKRQVDFEIAKATTEIRLWDDDPRGLGLRIKPSGSATFFIQYRSPVTFKKVRHTIGQYGRLTIHQARLESKRLFEVVTDGRDPAIDRRQARHDVATAATMSEFCDDYMRDAVAGLVTYRGRPKKQSTLAIDRGRIERHIKPTLGPMLVREVSSRDVEKAMHDIRLGKTAIDVKTRPRGRAVVTGGAGTAARTVTLLGSILSYAIKQGIRIDNPVPGVEIPPDGKRDRILLPDEYRRMGKALSDAEDIGANPVAIAAYRVLALTGCRKGEIFGLRKSEVDAHNRCLRLGDTKAGQQVRAIGNTALKIVGEFLGSGNSDYVFPASRGEGHITDVKLFRRICEDAALEGVSLHTLRHGFASVALELEYSELTIAGLLGHRSHSITSRYAHHVDRALVAAANRVSVLIADRMRSQGAEEVAAIHRQ